MLRRINGGIHCERLLNRGFSIICSNLTSPCSWQGAVVFSWTNPFFNISCEDMIFSIYQGGVALKPDIPLLHRASSWSLWEAFGRGQPLSRKMKSIMNSSCDGLFLFGKHVSHHTSSVARCSMESQNSSLSESVDRWFFSRIASLWSKAQKKKEKSMSSIVNCA